MEGNAQKKNRLKKIKEIERNKEQSNEMLHIHHLVDINKIIMVSNDLVCTIKRNQFKIIYLCNDVVWQFDCYLALLYTIQRCICMRNRNRYLNI